MFLTIEIILNVLGFICFLIIAILIVIIVFPGRGALTEPFRELMEITEIGIIFSSCVSVFIAIVFLINALYFISLIINLKCSMCWIRWQTKSFKELIAFFGFPSGAKADKVAPEELSEEEEPELEASVHKKPKHASEIESIGEFELNPIKVSKVPKWMPAQAKSVYLGFALDDKNHWSLRGNIHDELMVAVDR